MFKNKIKSFLIAFLNGAKKNPMECIASMIAVVIGILDIHGGFFQKYIDDSAERYYTNYRLFYFPIVFLLTNIIHYYTSKNKNWKWIYFVSGALLLLLMIFNIELNYTYYSVGMSSVILAYFSHKFNKNNEHFSNDVINIIVALIFAGFVSGITNLLLMSIKASINYLFNLNSHWKDMGYLAAVIWLCFFPILFLTFKDNSLKLNLKNKFTEIVFNYILTSALIIYTLIFYAYFLKIIIQWELPKGNVAYMVFGFGIGAYILKMLASLFVKDFFKWFYKKLSYFVLPAIILFWIGSIYRISQYGFTEERIYLFLGGIYLTLISVVLLSKKWGKFLYLSLGIIVVLSLFTYVPFFSAKKLGLVAQEHRFEQAIKMLGYSKIDSSITLKILDTSLQNKKAIKMLVSSFKYIYKENKNEYTAKKYGIKSDYQLEKIITEENYKMIYDNDHFDRDEYVGKLLELHFDYTRDIDVSGYKMLKQVSDYPKYDSYFCSNEYDSSRVIIFTQDSTIVFSANKDSLLLKQLKKIALPLPYLVRNGNASFSTKEREEFFCIETSKQKIFIQRYSCQKDSFKVETIKPYAILLK